MTRKNTTGINEKKTNVRNKLLPKQPTKRLTYQQIASINSGGFSLQAMGRHMIQYRIAKAKWREACRLLNAMKIQ